jgi:selenocysteine lyase/cysteine desulfurase
MTFSRRLFIRSLSAPALPASWLAFSRTMQSAGTPEPRNDTFWRVVKREFPLEEGLIYLNAANVCPASRPVMDRYLEYLRDFHANPSFQNRDKYEPLQERLREKLAALLGASSNEIAITRNTSEANNIVANGVELKSGDEILLTSHNHPSNDASWKVRARRHGLVVRSVSVPVPPSSREQLIAGFDELITPRTKVVAFTHVTNTTGILYPVKAIAELAHRRGAWVHVDGAQSFGALDFSLHDLGCDSYAASAHKWFMGPLEAGVLYVRAEKIPRLWPSVVSAGWADDLAGARKFEVFGQRDNPRLVAFEAGVDFINLIGQSAVESRMRDLAARLKRGLLGVPDLRLKTNLEPELSAGVVKFTLAHVPSPKAYGLLYSRHRIGLAMTPEGDSEGLRYCPHIYNTPEEVDQAVAAVKELKT